MSSGGPAAAGWGGALHFALTRLEGREGVSARWLPVAIEARCVLGLATLRACGAGTGERGGGASGVLARGGRCGRAARGPARGGVRRRASGRGPRAVRRGALAGLGFAPSSPFHLSLLVRVWVVCVCVVWVCGTSMMDEGVALFMPMSALSKSEQAHNDTHAPTRAKQNL